MNWKDYKLCYINEDQNRAYFTSIGLNLQNGEGWSKAPYQCNTYYPDTTHRPTDGSKEKSHDVIEVAFYKGAKYGVPAIEGYSSGPGGWSVHYINTGAIAWLATSVHGAGYAQPIMAGTTYKDFVTMLINDGGMVFSPSRNIRTGEWVDASK